MSYYDLYLSYSGRRSYLICPKKYYFSYILKDKVRGDIRGTLLGSIIGKVFEWFYTRRAWATADPVGTTSSWIDDATRVIFEHEKFDAAGDPAFCQMLHYDLLKYVPEGVEVIRKNGLLTPKSFAEVDLTVDYTSPKYGMTLRLGGRADFLHGHGAEDIRLIDGKASKHKDKYVDAEQLIWYATQHFIKYHIAPTQLGFLFWCFPEDPIKWVSYDNQAIRASLTQTFETAKKIQLKQFGATPSAECPRCDFRDRCEEGQKHIVKRKAEAGSRIESSIFDIEPV